MAGKSNIEWTGHSWNPLAGCSVLTPGCTNCYAMKLAARLAKMGQPLYDGLTKQTKGGAVWTGEMRRASESVLLAPLRRKTPTTYFVNSMSDLFHENVPDEWIDQIFAVMALCPQHTFQVLTKRADRMLKYCIDTRTPFRVIQAMDTLIAQRDVEPEEIMPIVDYPGYFVSSHGFIYSEKRGARRRLSPDIGEDGHQRVQLYRDDQETRQADRVLVHRLILETFVGPAPSCDTQGRHRDRNPSNNYLSNLRWGDQSANWDDAKRHGTHRRYSKLTEGQVAEIKRRHIAGETSKTLAQEFSVSDTQIRNITEGKQWIIEAQIQWPLINVWKGVSTERQKEADERIPLLLQTPAMVRFISAEPLLGPLDISPYLSLSWTIIGGESGRYHRDMNPDWAASLIDQCRSAGVPVFMKQMAGKKPIPPNLFVRQFPVNQRRDHD